VPGKRSRCWPADGTALRRRCHLLLGFYRARKSNGQFCYGALDAARTDIRCREHLEHLIWIGAFDNYFGVLAMKANSIGYLMVSLRQARPTSYDYSSVQCAIKALTERVSHCVFRVMALPAPSDREKTQIARAVVRRALGRQTPRPAQLHFPYPLAEIKLPKRSTKHQYDDVTSIKDRHFVASRY